MKNQIKTIDDAVFEGIRKTISRFRRKPFHYFTEADIHSSLLKDITEADPYQVIFRPNPGDVDALWKLRHISVALVHQEYPTHFRYKKDLLLNGYTSLSELEQTKLDYTDAAGKHHGDRGNFDLAVLNKDFIVRMMLENNLPDALEEIIHKNNKRALDRLENNPAKFSEELLFGIEVKFIHPFNARNIGMLHEVVKDDRKLSLARHHSNGHLKPVNLVFCSTPAKASRGNITPVVELIREYITEGKITDRNNNTFNHPDDVVTVFIESFIEGDSGSDEISTNKVTNKPVAFCPKTDWAKQLVGVLGIV